MRHRNHHRGGISACVAVIVLACSSASFARCGRSGDAAARGKSDSQKDPEIHDELVDDLLGGLNVPLQERVARLMENSKRRLESSDTGADTQAIQQKIVEGIDELLKEMEKGSKPPEKSGAAGGQMSKPKLSPGGTSSESTSSAESSRPTKGGNSPATQSKGPKTNASSGESFISTAEPFMKIAPRMRQAVIEGAGETVCEKYRTLVADYYKTIAQKSKDPSDR